MSHSRKEPDALHLSKEELIGYLELLPKRWEKNRSKNVIFSVPFQAAVKVMRSRWISEDDVKYYWTELIKLVGELQAENTLRSEAKEHPKMAPLFELQKQHLEKAIVSVPVSEYDFRKALLAQAKEHMAMFKQGSMPDG